MGCTINRHDAWRAQSDVRGPGDAVARGIRGPGARRHRYDRTGGQGAGAGRRFGGAGICARSIPAYRHNHTDSSVQYAAVDGDRRSGGGDTAQQSRDRAANGGVRTGKSGERVATASCCRLTAEIGIFQLTKRASFSRRRLGPAAVASPIMSQAYSLGLAASYDASRCGPGPATQAARATYRFADASLIVRQRLCQCDLTARLGLL